MDDVARWKWANLDNASEAICGPPGRLGPLNKVVRAEAVAVLDAASIE